MFLNSGLTSGCICRGIKKKRPYFHDTKCQVLFKSGHVKMVKTGHAVSRVPAKGFAVQHLSASCVILELFQRNEEPGTTCGLGIFIRYPYSNVV